MLTACEDDTFDSFGPREYPDGMATLKLQLDFTPVGSNGANPSRALSGNTMGKLDDLCLVAYDSKGDLMKGFPIQISPKNHNLQVVDSVRRPSDAANGQLAPDENVTSHASFDVKLPYGRYYLYALANLGSRTTEGVLVDSTKTALDTYEGLKEAVKTREGLLTYATKWDKKNPMNNFQMLGFFSNGRAEKAPVTGEKTNDVMVDVDSPSVSLHSWLRRSCAKVTIDFDASELRENIYVYIRRATIHNIPVKCRLGRPNAAKDESEVYSYKDKDYRPGGGDCIDFGTGDDHNSWPRVSKGAPYLKRGGSDFNWHSYNAPSLFLYENMKGNSEKDTTNKVQFPDDNGLVIGSTDVEDNMKGASYIEVEGYYSCERPDETSQGKIRYRFMLGEDALKNFDVERNRHIKLTMKLRGNGNDVDWHIEYQHEDGFEYKDPYYVSYLYNHQTTLHFRYTPPEGVKVDKIEAQIVANNWWADDASAGYDLTAMQAQSPIEPSLWKGDVLNATFGTRNVYPNDRNTEAKLRGKVKYLGNGWLSLREVNKLNINYEETSSHGTFDSNAWASHEDNKYMNDRFFYGVSAASGGIDQSYREYHFKDADATNKGNEAYTVEQNPDGSMRFNLPVFTRPKNLVKQTAYSGNNIYEGSTRTAIVQITLHLSNNTVKKQNLRVLQVPRLINPKGIYRKSGNNENFHVVLQERESPTSDNFIAVESDGPWMAEVIGSDNFISLNGKRVVKGSTGSNIDFNVMFNKLNTNSAIRTAIIRVRYHNLTCTHLIFVRQGYGALQIGPNGPEWHACNLIADGVDALDPRDEGSMFKFGCISDPIDVRSNQGYGFAPASLTPASFSAPKNFYIAKSDRSEPTTTKTWSNIKGKMSSSWEPENSKLPTIAQIAKMYNTANLQHGFGVLYADGATEVATTVQDAYGYYRHDAAAKRDKRGMRGVFMYYWDGKSVGGSSFNCSNMFFPIGVSGYGQRRSYDISTYPTEGKKAGTLRYSAGRTGEMPASAVPWQPQFYDLYRRNGAIYWAKNHVDYNDVTGSKLTDAIAMDLNYYTFDVNIIGRNNMQKHGMWSGCNDDSHINACFLRQVK